MTHTGGEPDWSLVARGLTDQPLRAGLAITSDTVKSVVQDLDVWLYDYQFAVLESLVTHQQQRPAVLAAHAGNSSRSGVIVAPLHLHGDRLGFLTARPAPGVSYRHGQEILDHLSSLVAAAIITSDRVTDAVAVTRRRKSLSLAAELQWTLLPPTRFETPSFTITASVEPAYETGGDVFDYATLDNHLHIAVLDAMGHGLHAALTATIAITALRRARRDGAGLLETVTEIDAAIVASDRDTFVTAVLVDLDLRTGTGHYLSAGHPPPVLFTNGQCTDLQLIPTLPIGMRIGTASCQPQLCDLHLQPSDLLILYSDGITENRLTTGAPAGRDTFTQLITTSLAATTRPPHHARNIIDELLALMGIDQSSLFVVEAGAGPLAGEHCSAPGASEL